jgi:peptidoglycan/LPS O-acetylase OafA/YrhL
MRSPGYLRVVGAGLVDRPAVAGASCWKRWLRLAIAAEWLLVAATISFVPKPRRPADEPMWKLVVWLILFLALASVVAYIWKGR